jgi:hypothetical protein
LSTGTTIAVGLHLRSNALLLPPPDQTNDARRCISEATKAIETTKERVHETEVNRITGEIALASPQREASNAQAYFERGLYVARQQQAKS